MSSPTSHVSPTPELSIPPRAPDPLSTGIKSLLDPTVKQTTEKLLQVHQSQQALSQELDRLITPTLQTIQLRVNKLYVQLSKQRLPH
ncbi:hypothetical protein C7212DRAFT_326066 [Tuber magnatum]|uniref:Uncharacterized protein n=1 Tax=Tuber magnatum TaxID=42249 RepID=A0A317SKV1_9PEZI|nr:hypothetical protein C7212DRAFT_326066 [Tuber magnatum]